jgi:hypothetical protein
MISAFIAAGVVAFGLARYLTAPTVNCAAQLINWLRVT